MPKPRPDPTQTDASTWLHRIRFRHLQVLVAIARHGSLTAAAAALDITQPAVSQWLADIEAAVGAPLFVRGHRLKATALAAPVIAHAERLLNDAQRVVGEVNAIRSGGTGLVRLGVMLVAAASVVPTAVLRLQKASPGIQLSLMEDTAAGLWVRFERNELDVLVTRLDTLALGSGLPQRRLFADRHHVVCGPQHPLAKRRRVAWRDLVAYPWLMPPSGTPLRDAVDMTFAGAGIAQPVELISSVSSTTNPILLNETHALAVMSHAAAKNLARYGVVHILPLVLTHDVGDVGLVWREHTPGPALSALLQAFG